MSVWEACYRSEENSKIQTAANQAVNWCTENNVLFHTDNTKEMKIYFGKKPLELLLIIKNNNEIDCVSVFKLLCLMFNNRLTWSDYIDYICGKTSDRIYFLCSRKRAGNPPSDIVVVLCSLVRSVLEYATKVLASLSDQGTKTNVRTPAGQGSGHSLPPPGVSICIRRGWS